MVKKGYKAEGLDKQNIEQFFEKVYLKRLSSSDANAARAEVQNTINTVTAEVEEKARPLSKKLEKLQASSQTLKQIQELSGMPEQLKKAKAKFDRQNLAKIWTETLEGVQKKYD